MYALNYLYLAMIFEHGWMTNLIVFCPSISQTLIDEPKEVKKSSTNKNYTFIDIFRTPNIRKLSIYLGLVW